jgi:hypothetical protein
LHASIKKDQRRQRLLVRRRGDIGVGRKMLEERRDLALAHLHRMAPAMEQDVPPRPLDVRLLRPVAVMPVADRLADLVEEARRAVLGGFAVVLHIRAPCLSGGRKECQIKDEALTPPDYGAQTSGLHLRLTGYFSLGLNMRRTLPLFAVMLLVAHPLRATAAEAAAMAVLQRYSTAIESNNCQTVVELTSEAVLRRDRLPNEFRSTICPMVAEWQGHNLKETHGEPKAHLVDGWRQVVFVRATRSFDGPDGRMVTDFDYVVHSTDGGATWRVLDLGCLDQRWVKEIFPQYDGKPQVHSASARLVAR